MKTETSKTASEILNEACNIGAERKSILFANWIGNNSWILGSNGLWYEKSDGEPDKGVTTEQLFAEFNKHSK